MTSLSPSIPRVVLADRVSPRTLLTDAILVLSGVALTAIFAQIAVPMYPVPITGQTLAVLLVGSTLGLVRGVIAMGLYAALGAVGLPIFSDGSSGFGVLMGPTGGYIIGFIASAALVGWLAERAWERKFTKAILTFLAGTVVTFAFGLPWLAAFLGSVGAPNDLQSVLIAGFYPFIIGGLIKSAIAAAVLPAAWWGADRLAAKRAAEQSRDSDATS